MWEISCPYPLMFMNTWDTNRKGEFVLEGIIWGIITVFVMGKGRFILWRYAGRYLFFPGLRKDLVLINSKSVKTLRGGIQSSLLKAGGHASIGFALNLKKGHTLEWSNNAEYKKSFKDLTFLMKRIYFYDMYACIFVLG